MRPRNLVPGRIMLSLLIGATLSDAGLLSTSAEVQPSVENNVLFLHYDPDQAGADRFFMDADSAGPEGEFVTNLSANGSLTLNFTLSPPLAKTIYPIHDGNNMFVRIHLKAESAEQDPFRDVWIVLRIGEARIFTNMPDTSQPDYFLFNCSEGMNAISPGTRISVEVSLNASVQTGIHFYADNTSTLAMKLGKTPDIGSGGRYLSQPSVVNWNAIFMLLVIAAIIAIVIAVFLWPSDEGEGKDN